VRSTLVMADSKVAGAWGSLLATSSVPSLVLSLPAEWMLAGRQEAGWVLGSPSACRCQQQAISSVIGQSFAGPPNLAAWAFEPGGGGRLTCLTCWNDDAVAFLAPGFTLLEPYALEEPVLGRPRPLYWCS
jgi:hypothetical protein